MKEGERKVRIRRAKASEPAVKRDSRNQDRTSTSTSPQVLRRETRGKEPTSRRRTLLARLGLSVPWLRSSRHGDDERVASLKNRDESGSATRKRNDQEGSEEKDVPLGWMVTRLAWIAAKLVSSTATSTLFTTSQRPALGRNPSDRRRAVLTKGDQVGLASLLQRSDSGRLESKVSLEVLSDLSNETLEGELPDQEFGGFLHFRKSKSDREGQKAMRVSEDRPDPSLSCSTEDQSRDMSSPGTS